MSVFISDFDQWTVVHDDAPGGSHQGTIDPATIQHTTNMDGSENHLFIMVPCPVCGAVSTHPVGGGAQPPLVQRLFIIHAQDSGCPCGAVQAGDTSGTPEAHVRLNVNRMDGIGRWQPAPA